MFVMQFTVIVLTRKKEIEYKISSTTKIITKPFNHDISAFLAADHKKYFYLLQIEAKLNYLSN